jgi:NTP pyrophosphatase (non-canonical NTP hydrolase)
MTNLPKPRSAALTSQEQVRIKNALSNAAAEVYRINYEKGWFDSDRTFGEDIALLHSEVSEALEAFREFGLKRYYEVKSLDPGLGTYRQDDNDGSPIGRPTHKPCGVASELADVLVRLLDTCFRYEIDLGNEFVKKLAYNDTRPFRHGGKNL